MARADDAAPPAAGDAASTTIALVHKELITPMKAREARTSKFSRAAVPPSERRVRVPDATLHTDARGAHFIRYSVDQRYLFDDEGGWNTDALSGCVYPEGGDVFVTVGGRARPAAAWTATSPAARKREAPPEACTDATDPPRG